jgi:hypothetical protein
MSSAILNNGELEFVKNIQPLKHLKILVTIYWPSFKLLKAYREKINEQTSRFLRLFATVKMIG